MQGTLVRERVYRSPMKRVRLSHPTIIAGVRHEPDEVIDLAPAIAAQIISDGYGRPVPDETPVSHFQSIAGRLAAVESAISSGGFTTRHFRASATPNPEGGGGCDGSRRNLGRGFD